VVADGAVHREVGGTLWRARQDGPGLVVDVEGDPDLALADLRRRVGEDLPWAPVAALAAADDRVHRLVEAHPGYRPPITPDPFEAIVGAISAQQVNLRWALTTRTRLVRALGTPRDTAGTVVWTFPAADRVAMAHPSELRELQFTNAKAKAIVEVAGAAADGHLDGLADLTNDAVVARLTELRGVGRWTAEQVLARSLARPNAVAAGDLGVRKAVSRYWHGSDELLEEAVVRDTTTAWGDAANWVTHLLLEELAMGGRSRTDV
jgi:DNA-3-methyladenine glycosylase II